MMKFRVLSAMVILNVAVLASGCSSESSGDVCVPSECVKPVNATEMACDANGCFVRKCDSGYKVTADGQACSAATADKCVASQCPKPDGAIEMACGDSGCFVKNCASDYEKSEDNTRCISTKPTENPDKKCVVSECVKPEHAEEMACSNDVCIVKSCHGDYRVSDDKKSCVDKTSDTPQENSCVPSECIKPEHAAEMACDANGCFVRKCDSGYVVSNKGKACEPEDPDNKPEEEVCPKIGAKCDTLFQTLCCNGREFACNYVDECEGNWDCKDWIWWANLCTERFDGGWCAETPIGDGGTAFGCVFNKDSDPCNEHSIGHVLTSALCDTKYNNMETFICGKTEAGEYAYMGKGYAQSFCKDNDKNIKIECDKTHHPHEVTCNDCTESYDGANFHAACK